MSVSVLLGIFWGKSLDCEDLVELKVPLVTSQCLLSSMPKMSQPLRTMGYVSCLISSALEACPCPAVESSAQVRIWAVTGARFWAWFLGAKELPLYPALPFPVLSPSRLTLVRDRHIAGCEAWWVEKAWGTRQGKSELG